MRSTVEVKLIAIRQISLLVLLMFLCYLMTEESNNEDKRDEVSVSLELF